MSMNKIIGFNGGILGLNSGLSSMINGIYTINEKRVGYAIYTINPIPSSYSVLTVQPASGDSTVVDYSPLNNNPSTLHGSVSLTTSQFYPGYEKSISFTGTSSLGYVTFPFKNDYQIYSSNYWACRVRFRRSSTCGASGTIVCVGGVKYVTPTHWGIFNRSDGRIVFNGQTSTPLATINAISNDVWYTILVTKAGTTYKMYLDGVLQSTQTGYYAIARTDIPLIIGCETDQDTPFFFGGYVQSLQIFQNVIPNPTDTTVPW